MDISISCIIDSLWIRLNLNTLDMENLRKDDLRTQCYPWWLQHLTNGQVEDILGKKPIGTSVHDITFVDIIGYPLPKNK